ncbi:hypothetical protein LSH36_14g04042 [Paralvinella palmiformis]|uniref:Uncharacterized protein n=1 Tax=Paralvinella palmiformis TaxID=53620 RepID=A0AAD9NFW9_9ANNE|nr:hypothetical protein LSH36_14g04042 [Paralvinella palmiformis]
METANILIGTPGRLEDMLKRKDDINLAARVKSLVTTTGIICL